MKKVHQFKFTLGLFETKKQNKKKFTPALINCPLLWAERKIFKKFNEIFKLTNAHNWLHSSWVTKKQQQSLNKIKMVCSSELSINLAKKGLHIYIWKKRKGQKWTKIDEDDEIGPKKTSIDI